MTEDQNIKEPSNRSMDAQDPPPSSLIWAVRLVSVGLIAAIVGYLIYGALSPTVPANFEITHVYEGVERRDNSWVLPVEVKNLSTRSVTRLRVESALTTNNEKITREVEVNLLGEGEIAKLELRFPVRPERNQVETQILSYQSP